MRERRSTLLQTRGFSLIEFITSGALTLLLLAGVGAIFIGSRTSYGKAEQLGQIQENGRYALDQISRDLRMAGFPGCSNRTPFTTTLPATFSQLTTPLLGFEASAGGTWAPALQGEFAQLALPSSDVLVISTMSVPIMLRAAMQSDTDALRIERAANQQVREGDLLLASNCQARAAFTITSVTDDVLEYAANLVSNPSQATQSLGFAFPIDTELMQIQTRTYFLRSDPKTSRAALWRQVGSEEPEQMASGIEDMQLTFGVDLNDDAVVDVDTTADQVTDWSKVMTVSITLLVVAEGSSTPNSVDGGKSAGLRETFTAAVTLRNRKTVESM